MYSGIPNPGCSPNILVASRLCRQLFFLWTASPEPWAPTEFSVPTYPPAL